jgi:methionyl-tRNA formyltransferase
MSAMRAVVFAYHSVGVRCLRVLLAQGVDVPLVFTHEDDPAEERWFESVTALCEEKNIPYITSADLDANEAFQRIDSARSDFIFSFYYRRMIPPRLLALARIGAFNMHGSLLPKYRGRAPVNWAVLHGETVTGATLHEMTARPDAGPLVAQTAVPILPDDTAFEVFGKVAVAAEMTLWQALPEMLNGRIARMPNNLAAGSYFGQRRPEDGRIDWTQPAQQIYNLHRAVAPPYPGAWTIAAGRRFTIGKARMAQENLAAMPCGLAVMNDKIYGVGGDGRAIRIDTLLANGKSIDAQELQRMLRDG